MNTDTECQNDFSFVWLCSWIMLFPYVRWDYMYEYVYFWSFLFSFFLHGLRSKIHICNIDFKSFFFSVDENEVSGYQKKRKIRRMRKKKIRRKSMEWEVFQTFKNLHLAFFCSSFRLFFLFYFHVVSCFFSLGIFTFLFVFWLFKWYVRFVRRHLPPILFTKCG